MKLYDLVYDSLKQGFAKTDLNAEQEEAFREYAKRLAWKMEQWEGRLSYYSRELISRKHIMAVAGSSRLIAECAHWVMFKKSDFKARKVAEVGLDLCIPMTDVDLDTHIMRLSHIDRRELH